MDALAHITTKAKARKRRVALPEAGLDIRMVQAARLLVDRGWAEPLLVGERSSVEKLADEARHALQRLAYLGCGGLALNRGRKHDHRNVRRTAFDDRQHIADCRTGCRGDQRYFFGMSR